jgi:anionic cell wall polymer biosynthesis LytR-Cps2A-Psr (LCP) family protein
MKKAFLDPTILVILLMVLVAVVFSVVLLGEIRRDRITQYLDSNDTMPVLVVITHNDQIVLSHLVVIHTNTNRVGIFDIPYNLGMILSDLGRVDRISALFEERGIQAFQDRIASFLATTIPFRLELSLNQLEGLTDLLGGIPLTLDQVIDVQQDQDIIRIPNGDVVLEGVKISGFLRYQGVDEITSDKTIRDLAFTESFIFQLGEKAALLNHGSVQAQLERFILSNLDQENLLNLIQFFSTLDKSSVITQRVLGNERLVQTPEGEIPLLFPHFDGQLSRDAFRQTLVSLSQAPNLGTDITSIRVEVLNGTRVTGLAGRTRDLLLNYGVQVVGIGNADDQDVEFTQIIYHTNEQLASRIGELIRGRRIIPGTGSFFENADVTLILGRDFDGWFVR